jgi:cysteine synthase A
MKALNILGTIGNTPHVRMQRLFGDAEVWMKMERANPGGSVKDRIGLAMIEDAEQRGILTEKSIIIEPTSGNTGIGLAIAAGVKGYRLIIVMPESMSIERRRLLKAYGAELDLTPREKGMRGAIDRAEELAAKTPNAWIPQQFENQANYEIHRTTTAQEILHDFPDGFDMLISGVGTGGHLSGCADVLKKKFPKLKVFAVEPSDSPVIGGGKPGPHALQGLGAGFIPKNLHTDLLDGTVQITKKEAFEYTIRCAREEGILAGISTGAALAAVAKKIPELPKGGKILTFCADTGERYLSVEGMF